MKLPESQIHYIDRPDISETFADSFGVGTFDGATTRLELCVTRLDPPNPPKPATARKYPICRLVLTPEATVELFNQLSGLLSALQQAGLVKKQEGKPPEAIVKH